MGNWREGEYIYLVMRAEGCSVSLNQLNDQFLLSLEDVYGCLTAGLVGMEVVDGHKTYPAQPYYNLLAQVLPRISAQANCLPAQVLGICPEPTRANANNIVSISAHKQLRQRVVGTFATQMLLSLREMHLHGCVAGDLRTRGNFLLSSENSFRMIDFEKGHCFEQ